MFETLEATLLWRGMHEVEDTGNGTVHCGNEVGSSPSPVQHVKYSPTGNRESLKGVSHWGVYLKKITGANLWRIMAGRRL